MLRTPRFNKLWGCKSLCHQLSTNLRAGDCPTVTAEGISVHFLIVVGLVDNLFPRCPKFVCFFNYTSQSLFKIFKKTSQRLAHPFPRNHWRSQMEVSCTTNKWANMFSKEQLRVPEIMLGGMPRAQSWETSSSCQLLSGFLVTLSIPENCISFLGLLWDLRKLQRRSHIKFPFWGS